MSVSVVDICNSALYKIGSTRISSLDEQNKRAIICKDIYSKIRDEVLRAHPWNFATKRIQLAQETASPTFGYDYQYTLPSDCLRVLGVSYDSSLKTNNRILYKIEGNLLLSDETQIYIEYIFKETNTTNYDPNFIEALSFRLAQELAYPIVQSSELTDRLRQNYREWIADARTFDGQEGSPQEQMDDTFIDSRYFGSYYDEGVFRETR